jgi:lipopolysaccharide export system permease protein
MRLSLTLTGYLGRRFLASIAVVMVILLGLVVLFEMVELLRRASGRESANFGILLEMALLKTPLLAQKIIPFAALFAGMYSFARLTRANELVVARAAGVSVWQFLMPALATALILGGLVVTVFNPLSSAMVYRYEQMEAKHLRGRPSLLAVSNSGIWLRQADENGQSVIHAQGVSQQGLEFQGVIIFLFEDADRFVSRIDARTAKLHDKYWELTDAVLTEPQGSPAFRTTYRLETSLTYGQIQDSFASPETMSFWALPKFIDMMQKTGFSAVRHRLHWHAMLSGPLLLFSMVLIAATFALRLTRYGSTALLTAGGVLAGFVLYFLSDITFALGLSGAIPAILAAWTPAGVATLLGLGMLFHLEDG